MRSLRSGVREHLSLLGAVLAYNAEWLAAVGPAMGCNIDEYSEAEKVDVIKVAALAALVRHHPEYMHCVEHPKMAEALHRLCEKRGYARSITSIANTDKKVDTTLSRLADPQLSVMVEEYCAKSSQRVFRLNKMDCVITPALFPSVKQTVRVRNLQELLKAKTLDQAFSSMKLKKKPFAYGGTTKGRGCRCRVVVDTLDNPLLMPVRSACHVHSVGKGIQTVSVKTPCTQLISAAHTAKSSLKLLAAYLVIMDEWATSNVPTIYSHRCKSKKPFVLVAQDGEAVADKAVLADDKKNVNDTNDDGLPSPPEPQQLGVDEIAQGNAADDHVKDPLVSLLIGQLAKLVVRPGVNMLSQMEDVKSFAKRETEQTYFARLLPILYQWLNLTVTNQ